MKRASIVPGKGAYIVGSKDEYEAVKFATVEEFIRKGKERKRVDGNTGGEDGEGQRICIRKDRVKSDLSVKEVEWPEVRGARRAVGSENSSHMGRENRGGRGRSNRVEDKILELGDGEKGNTFVGVIGQNINAGIMTKRSKFED